MSRQTVFVVDDNPRMLRSVRDFLRASGLRVETFVSARAFLDAFDPEKPGCLVLDIRLPGMSGVELLEELRARGSALPVLIVSGQASIGETVQAMKLGPFEFLEKPYPPALLLARIREALKHDERARKESRARAQLHARYERLTRRERQILSRVVSGQQSKVIASEVGLSVSTVDNHRANMMKRLSARTSAELVRIALTLEPELGLGAPGSVAG